MKPKSVERRILDHVSICEVTGCWEWTGRLNPKGYGKIHADRYRRVHRVAYECFVGPLIEGLTIDHLCKNKRCVNPKHLEQVTLAENMARAGLTVPGASHCINGHEYTEENTYRSPNKNGRNCRQCMKVSSLRFYARSRAA